MKHINLALAAFMLAAPAAWAGNPNLVLNWDFSQTTNGAGNSTGLGEFIPTGGVNHDPSLSLTGIDDWNTILTGNQGAPFLFVVDPTTLDTTGFLDSWDYGYRHLWGSHNGGNDVIAPAPTGQTTALLMDGDYNITPIYQALSGLVKGQKYNVSFEWAAGQWSQNTGKTTENIEVGLGGVIKNSAGYVNPVTGRSEFQLGSHDFSGWMSYSANFVYNGVDTLMNYGLDYTGETFDAMPNWLTFIAQGTPAGEPPTVLMTGLNVTQIPITSVVPEPASWAMMILGVGGLGFVARCRRALAMA